MRHAALTLAILIVPLCSTEPASCQTAAESAATSADRTIRPVDLGIDPKLPNVLIIGDSISIHYTSHVVAGLSGKANVFHSGGRWGCNAGSTGISVKMEKQSGKRPIESWLAFRGNVHFCGKKPSGAPKRRDYDLSTMGLSWDVIVANWGLWDIIRPDPQADNDDRILTPLDKYKENLEILFDRMRGTGAELIWVSTTPVPPTNIRNRRDEDVVAYNAAAAANARRHGATICDLYSLVKPKITPAWRRHGDPNEVHFSRELGNPFLGKQVAEAVVAALNTRSSR